jgi:hypothetical protein
MKYCLDDRFTLSSNEYNWILTEKQTGKKVRRHYFTSIKQLSNFIGELKLRECLVRGEVSLCNKSSPTPSYSSVIESTIGKLEHYIDSIIKGN